MQKYTILVIRQNIIYNAIIINIIIHHLAAQIDTVGGTAGIVGHKAVEVYLSPLPLVGQHHADALRMPIYWSRQESGIQRWTEGDEVYLVLRFRPHVQRILLERNGDDTILLLHLAESHRCHGPLADNQPLVIHLQTAFTIGKTVAIKTEEIVTFRHVCFHSPVMQSNTEYLFDIGGITHHLPEEGTVMLLSLGAGIAHETRTRAHAPLTAPLIADNGSHRTTETVVDSKTLLCHNIRFKR